MMKALSFRQPWAELILQGRKTMDLRTYSTDYRGRIAIHVSQQMDREAALTHGLMPDNLPAGGVIGTVEIVDVIALDEAAYARHRDEHLAGRSYRPGMFGWILADPQRLPEPVAMAGQQRLFEIDLATTPATPTRPTAGAAPHRPTAGSPYLNGTTPDKPFALHVQPLQGDTTDYMLTLRQRVIERPEATPHLETIVSLGGDALRAVADHVIEALRRGDYRATDLTPARQKPFYLPEEAGVRLGLVFLTVKPLTKYRRMEQISYGIRQMPAEEAYYWYSKCTSSDTAERAQKALRVLLAAE